jgi:hypothetical protein
MVNCGLRAANRRGHGDRVVCTYVAAKARTARAGRSDTGAAA